jgi:hypothetical protein
MDIHVHLLGRLKAIHPFRPANVFGRWGDDLHNLLSRLGIPAATADKQQQNQQYEPHKSS